MDLDRLANSGWVRAAIQAQMVMSQSLSGDELDELGDSGDTATAEAAGSRWAA